MNNFDILPKLRNTNSVKYRFKNADILPLWVADMDFACGEFINDGLRSIISNNRYAYSMIDDDFYNMIIRWHKKDDVVLEKKDILYANGVVPSIKACIMAFSEVGDFVLIQSPVYAPFFSSISDLDRKILDNPLILDDNKVEIDFEDFEEKVKKAKIFLFCNPQNPTTRVFDKKEVEKLAFLCKKHNTIILSDEIHSDFVYKKKHISMASIKEVEDISIILDSASKSFNLASFHTSYLISKNMDMKNKINEQLDKFSLNSPNVLGIQTLISAYDKGDIWLKEVISYIEKNLDYLMENLNKKITFIKPQGTYLIFLNFKNFNLSHEEIKNILIKKCKLVLVSGTDYGDNGNLFFRLNLATNKENIKEAVLRLNSIKDK